MPAMFSPVPWDSDRKQACMLRQGAVTRLCPNRLRRLSARETPTMNLMLAMMTVTANDGLNAKVGKADYWTTGPGLPRR